jgi:hypothetical protein
VLYVANKNMSPKEAETFSKLLREMIGSMQSLSWPEATLRNAAPFWFGYSAVASLGAFEE